MELSELQKAKESRERPRDYGAEGYDEACRKVDKRQTWIPQGICTPEALEAMTVIDLMTEDLTDWSYMW